MARVTVQFLDDEVLVGEAEPDLDRPEFWLDIEDEVGNNNRRALVPLVSVKSILLSEFEAEVPEDASKVAVRFHDGEVLRGYLNGGLEKGTYGLTIKLYTPSGLNAEVLGIPYSALKAIFYLKTWDSRAPEDRDGPSQAYLETRLRAPLVGILTEIDMLQRLRQSGVLNDGEFAQKRDHLLDRI